MNNIAIKKITNYSEFHSNFLKKVYLSNNFEEDTKEGNETFIDFVSVEKSKKRITEGSCFYELIIDRNSIGIFEVDENHLSLLFICNEFQKKGMGIFCIETIKFVLKNDYSELTVFASPYSLDFYLKNGFIKQSEDKKMIKGMNYYPMSLKLK